MNIMHTMASEARTRTPKRRFYSAELKLQGVGACARPGASIAGVALQHGINTNIVHRWLRDPMRPPRAVTSQNCVASPRENKARDNTPRRLLHQLRARRDVPIGVPHAGVAKIGGKRRELLLDVDAFAIPAQQRANGEPMPEVVHARSRTIARAPQTNLTRQTPEDAMNVLMQQWARSDVPVRCASCKITRIDV